METLGAKRLIKTSQWRPGHVPYPTYPRYATGALQVGKCYVMYSQEAIQYTFSIYIVRVFFLTNEATMSQ